MGARFVPLAKVGSSAQAIQNSPWVRILREIHGCQLSKQNNPQHSRHDAFEADGLGTTISPTARRPMSPMPWQGPFRFGARGCWSLRLIHYLYLSPTHDGKPDSVSVVIPWRRPSHTQPGGVIAAVLPEGFLALLDLPSSSVVPRASTYCIAQSTHHNVCDAWWNRKELPKWSWRAAQWAEQSGGRGTKGGRDQVIFTWSPAALSGVPHRGVWHTQDASPFSSPEKWHATVLCKPHTLAHTPTPAPTPSLENPIPHGGMQGLRNPSGCPIAPGG